MKLKLNRGILYFSLLNLTTLLYVEVKREPRGLKAWGENNTRAFLEKVQ